MIDSSVSQERLFKDGTSQQDREVKALHPDYVPVEGRSTSDLIIAAQRLAKELRFFNEQNESVATWELFLVEDPSTYHALSPMEKAAQQEIWARKLAAYVENPASFISDQKTLNRLSRPHIVLFLTFLKLLNYLKTQINGLTKRHLDFYFLDRLKMTPKEATPDVVNLLMGLAENVDQVKIPKGTVFLADTDEEGNDLHYRADEDTLISKAHVAKLKNVFVDKQLTTLESARREKGVYGMMKLALGMPNPGDDLPPLPAGAADLFELEKLVDNQNREAITYVNEQLYLSLPDFKQIIQTEQKSSEEGDVNFDHVYALLDRAFKDKAIRQGQLFLKEIHEKEDFEQLLKHVYGTPDPGNNLPVYRSGEASLEVIQQDLKSEKPDRRRAAADYLTEELKFTPQEFNYLVDMSNQTDASEEEKSNLYQLLERANRQVRNRTLSSPTLENIADIYALADAKTATFSEYGGEDESERFKTFGNINPGAETALKPASLGFAISSPTLQLQEGEREIITLLDFGSKPKDVEVLESAFKGEAFPALQAYLSSADQWVHIEDPAFLMGDHLGLESEGEYVGSFSDTSLTITEGEPFSISDQGKYLISPSGQIHEILGVEANDQVSIALAGQVADYATENIIKYAPEQVYLKSLKVVINRTAGDLPIVPNAGTDVHTLVHSDFPTLIFSLHHQLNEEAPNERYSSQYQSLQHLELQKVHLSVKVEGMQELTLQNDQNVIEANKPFEPFGSEPDVGNSFYVTHEEISRKKLDSLELSLEWMKAPDSISAHYQNYWRIEEEDADFDPGLSDDSWTASGFFYDRNAKIPVTPDSKEEKLKLFASDGKISIQNIPSLMKQFAPGYSYKQDPTAVVGEEEVLSWDRYFRLELDPLDFQHSVYPTLFSKQALSKEEPIKGLVIPPPYDPKLKSVKLSYKASADMVMGSEKKTAANTFYHLHPFGFSQPAADEGAIRLLPSYQDQGTLYLGVAALKPSTELSILFQMAEGSANPDVESPKLQWSYLRTNEWVPLALADILFDTTNGLVNTGIVRIKVPADVTTGGNLLPDDMHWLKLSAAENISGVSDIITVSAQAISATLSSEAIAPSHFKRPLPSETISETLDPLPEIATITQPYTSEKGKPKEEDQALYRRVSERIRHKNRALSSWDYEHMLLEKFPQVYKAKCIPATDELGKVEVIVIPDIRGKLPFNPFQPKVAADTLFQIQHHLDAFTPAYADVVVRNPAFLQVLTRCVVKFQAGLDEGFHQEKLINEVKRFLSPWAYDIDSDIPIGGTLHASTLINFIAERPYIDYVANLKLFQSEDGEMFEDVRKFNEGQAVVIPSAPDVVMVSAQTHFIDVVDENGYNEDNYEGVGYMKIPIDFIVQ